MTAVRGAFSYLLAPGFRKIFFSTFKERPTQFTDLFNVLTSTRAFEEDFPMAGFGPFDNMSEGQAVTYSDPLQGVKKRYTPLRYGKGFRVTEEMMEDDLYAQMRKAPALLAKSARNSAETIAFSILNNAFSASYVGFEAGVALCSVSHAVLRTGTAWTNKPSTDLDLSLPALQAAVEHFQNLTDHEGMPLVIMPKWLVFGANGSYWWLANQLLKSQMLPGGNDNDINQMAREGIAPKQVHYLTDGDAWFLMAGKGDHDLNFTWRKKPTFSNGDDFETGDAKFKGVMRAVAGFGEARGIYGSQGA